MKPFALVLLLLSLPAHSLWGARVVVSPSGNDANPGTMDLPMRTIAAAAALSSPAFGPGDTILVRGGIYADTATISISTSGTPAARCYLLAAPGERPILDFSAMRVASTKRGMNLRGSYWTVRGIDFKGAGDNGMNVSGSNNVIEGCAFYENRDTGLQLGGGASHNRVINCDAYYNADVNQGNADGFAPKLDVGSGNAFIGCRAWQNSDDGWDGYLRGANDVSTTLENCWSFMNGYLKNGSPGSGNGNGFKMGGSDTKDLSHNVVLTRCLSFDNLAKGFDQNSNRGTMTLLQCTAFRDNRLYVIADPLAYAEGKQLDLTNCVALNGPLSLSDSARQRTNSWMAPFAPITDADFLSIDTSGLRGPRTPDGALPDVRFMVPAPGSRLIDGGTDVGLPFLGTAPDLGAFETEGTNGVLAAPTAPLPEFRLIGSYPNPFNMAVTIAFALPRPGDVAVEIVDLQGSRVFGLSMSGLGTGPQTVRWNGTGRNGLPVSSGVYFAHLQFGSTRLTTKLVLMK
jgi:hypothetical protein